MRLRTTLTTLAAAAVATPLALANSGGGDIVINEIRTDQPGGDVDEYFELRGTPGASLDGLTYVVIGDGSGGSGVIDAGGAIDLSGVIPASGYFVAAEASFTLGVADLTADLGFENSDNVTHLLVEGFTGSAGDDLDTDDDGVLDVTPWTAIVDSVALREEIGGGDLLYSPNICGPNGTFVPGHFYLESDGTDSLVHYAIGEFDTVTGVDTPGAANAAGSLLPQAFGGNMGMNLCAGPANGGNLYLTLLGVSGTAPGTPAGSFLLPLNFDALLSSSLASAGSPPFINTLGFLDANGDAPFNEIAFPVLPAGFVGLTVNAASIVLNPVNLEITFVSNAVGVSFD